MSNHMLTGEHVLREAFDLTTGALKTVPSAATSFSIELNADDGDSSISRSESISLKASITNANTGVIVPENSAYGLKSITLYTKTTTTLVGPQVCTLEVSPSDSDDVWIASSLTITPSTTLNVVIASTPISIVARRVRVRIAAAITSGTFDVYVVGHSV